MTEAAVQLRIGRTVAYALAARFEETDGAEGLPVVRVGRLLRVPRARLEAWAGGPLPVLEGPAVPAAVRAEGGRPGAPTTVATPSKSADDDGAAVQLTLPTTAA